MTLAVAEGAARTFAVLGSTRKVMGLGVDTAMVGRAVPVAVGRTVQVGEPPVVAVGIGVAVGSAKRSASPPTQETTSAVNKKNTAVLAKGIHWFLARSSAWAPSEPAGVGGDGCWVRFRLGGRSKGSGEEGGRSFMIVGRPFCKRDWNNERRAVAHQGGNADGIFQMCRRFTKGWPRRCVTANIARSSVRIAQYFPERTAGKRPRRIQSVTQPGETPSRRATIRVDNKVRPPNMIRRVRLKYSTNH